MAAKKQELERADTHEAKQAAIDFALATVADRIGPADWSGRTLALVAREVTAAVGVAVVVTWSPSSSGHGFRLVAYALPDPFGGA